MLEKSKAKVKTNLKNRDSCCHVLCLFFRSLTSQDPELVRSCSSMVSGQPFLDECETLQRLARNTTCDLSHLDTSFALLFLRLTFLKFISGARL